MKIDEKDPIMKALRKLFKADAKRKTGPPARRMRDICVAIRQMAKGDTVTSAMSARVRVRLGLLIDDGTITVTGVRAATRYTASLVD